MGTGDLCRQVDDDTLKSQHDLGVVPIPQSDLAADAPELQGETK